MKIVDAIDKVFDVVDKVVTATDEDSAGGKKVTLTEGIGIGISAIGIIPAFTAFHKLAEDWRARDVAQKAEWVQAFKERFDIPDDELEQQIEELVEAILMIEGSINILAQKRK